VYPEYTISSHAYPRILRSEAQRMPGIHTLAFFIYDSLPCQDAFLSSVPCMNPTIYAQDAISRLKIAGQRLGCQCYSQTHFSIALSIRDRCPSPPLPMCLRSIPSPPLASAPKSPPLSRMITPQNSKLSIMLAPHLI